MLHHYVQESGRTRRNLINAYIHRLRHKIEYRAQEYCNQLLNTLNSNPLIFNALIEVVVILKMNKIIQCKKSSVYVLISILK